jgi:thioredoxin reductase (NADPH)
MRRFGNLRSFAAGESLWTVGQVAPGLMVILAGKVAVNERDQFDNHKPIAVHGPGYFLGELELLSGRAALVDANAQEPLEALIIPSERPRALMIAEAELGERNMRALIWRRVAILEAGIGGPIILGRAESGDVLRLQGFLRRNGHPHQLLNPETDAPAAPKSCRPIMLKTCWSSSPDQISRLQPSAGAAIGQGWPAQPVRSPT